MALPIVMTAYCRPELTRNSIISLVERFPEINLIVSQDGKIPGFYEEDHAKTRLMLMAMEKEYPQIKVNLRSRNIGLTGHLKEVFKETLQSHSSLIFLEEDMWIDTNGLEFLNGVKFDQALSHRSAYSTTNHPLSSKLLEYRLSNFPEQWGVAINYECFEAFRDEISRRSVERNLVRKVIRNSGYSRVRAEILSDFWTQLLRQEIESPHGWDSTLQLALWRNNSPSRVAIRSFVRDLGGGEGSITKRTQFPTKRRVKPKTHNTSLEKPCLACEEQDAFRRRFSSTNQIRNRLRIRSRFMHYRALRTYL